MQNACSRSASGHPFRRRTLGCRSAAESSRKFKERTIDVVEATRELSRRPDAYDRRTIGRGVRVGEPNLVGRADELSQVGELLEHSDRLPSAWVAHGEAGIGKTTLWLAATARAAEQGYRVLASRPSEVETGYAFAGLTDLAADVADEVSAALPTAQRRALDAALLRGAQGSTPGIRGSRRDGAA